MDSDQGSHNSRYSNESGRSTLRRTGGLPDMSSQYSVHSGRSIRKRSGSRRTGGPPDDSSSNLGHSIGSLVPRSRQVPKPRNLLNDRIQWNGQYSLFRSYKLAISGHLLQVGAGYLVDKSFHASYLKYSKLGEDYLESEDFRVTYPDITNKQARLDRNYLYGMLLSSNRNDGEQKIIFKYETSQDGIAAWIEFLRDYDNNGSEEARASKLENMVSTKYNHKCPGGLLKYIDTLQANLIELDTLLPDQYPESRKRRILFKNLNGVKSLMHLVQGCKDRDLSYQEAATYLRIYGAELDEDDQDSRMSNQAEKEGEKKYLSYEETRELFTLMTEEQGARRAFEVLTNGPKFRESVNIHPRIWKRLSEEIKIEIGSIRTQRNVEDSREQPKTQVLSHYGPNRDANRTVKWDDRADRMAAVTQSYRSYDADFPDDEYDSDDGVRMIAMVHRVGEDVEVQINEEESKVISTKPERQAIVKQDTSTQGRDDPYTEVPTRVDKTLINPVYLQKLQGWKNAIKWRELKDEIIIDSAKVWNPGE